MQVNVCEVCGNYSTNSFTLVQYGKSHEFDSLQCAIQKLAPTCASCSCRILGQRIEENGFSYCGPHCQRMAGRNLSTEEMNPMP